MHPLILTFAFLMLMTTMVTTEMKRFVSHISKDALNLDYLSARSTAERESTLSLFHALKDQTMTEKKKPTKKSRNNKEKKPKKPSPLRSLNYDLACPPNNARLNFYVVLIDDEKKLYEPAARLLRNLYGHTSFFQNDSLLEYKLLDALILKREEAKGFLFPDELAKIALEGDLQTAFSQLLRGGFDEKGSRLVPLTDYISFTNDCNENVNLLFASQPVLEAVLGNNQVVEKLLLLRSELWPQIIEQEENYKNMTVGLTRTTIKKDLEKSFDSIVSEAGMDVVDFKKKFDFSLGKAGNYLMTTDPETGLPIREKLVQVPKKTAAENAEKKDDRK